MFEWMKTAKKEASTLKRLEMIIDQKDVGAEFVWRVLRDTMAYSAVLLEEIANFEPLSLIMLSSGLQLGVGSIPNLASSRFR